MVEIVNPLTRQVIAKPVKKSKKAEREERNEEIAAHVGHLKQFMDKVKASNKAAYSKGI